MEKKNQKFLGQFFANHNFRKFWHFFLIFPILGARSVRHWHQRAERRRLIMLHHVMSLLDGEKFILHIKSSHLQKIFKKFTKKKWKNFSIRMIFLTTASWFRNLHILEKKYSRRIYPMEKRNIQPRPQDTQLAWNKILINMNKNWKTFGFSGDTTLQPKKVENYYFYFEENFWNFEKKILKFFELL